jgi:thiamine transporter ThiT
MLEASVLNPSTSVVPRRAHIGSGVLALLFIIIVVFLALRQFNLPHGLGVAAPAAEFASARAMKQLEVIARRPHPIGSASHGEVRDYILSSLSAMGLSPEVQKTTAVNQKRNATIISGTVENIVVKVPGTNNNKAIMLVSHYDSVPTSFGASDDGSGVSVMLETLRTLKARAPLRNDVVGLFTDGEEVGLLGAKAFVDEHPWAGNIGMVLNFEARGNTGPVIMFETSANNQILISEFAKAVRGPVANSSSNEIYKRLPNNTDLTVFKEAGLPGLNFAYIEGLNHYHTYLDTFTGVDERSIQQDGSYAVALTTHFGNLGSIGESKSSAVYFDVLGAALFHYSIRWVLPLGAFVMLFFVAVTAFGLKRGRLRTSGIALGLAAFASSLVIAWLAGSGLWWMLQKLYHEQTPIIQGDVYHSQFFFISFVGITVALVSALYLLVFRRVSRNDLATGALLGMLILSSVSIWYLPAVSYLFAWPLLFSTIALGSIFNSRSDDASSLKKTAVLSICATPGLLLFVPLIYLSYTAATLSAAGALMVMVALLLGTLIPHLRLMSPRTQWLAPAVLALIGAGFFVAGSFTSVYRQDQPKSDNIFYALNADSGKAAWVSIDQKPDEWTSQFFAGRSEKGPVTEYLPIRYDGFLKGDAPALALAAPQLELLSDERNDSGRKLKIRISSPRLAPVIFLTVDSDSKILNAEINGKRTISDQRERWAMNYFAPPPEGVVLMLETTSTAVKIRAVDQSYELPDVPGRSFKVRPGYLIPKPFTYSDSTLVSKTYTF